MEHTYDSIGQPKEVIVIQDSASPIPKKRTRAVAQAEAQRWAAQQSGSNGHSSLANGTSSTQTKKRKVEADDVHQKPKSKKVAPVSTMYIPVFANADKQPDTSCPSASSTSAATRTSSLQFNASSMG